MGKKSLEFGPSAISERKEFYEKEFSIQKVKSWFKGRKLPRICALDAGTETGIIINKQLKGNMFYFPFSKLKSKIRQYCPEDVYYDRNEYANPKKALNSLKFNKFISQELVFDIDHDNIRCSCRNRGREQVCNKCISKAYRFTVKMCKELKKEFKNLKVVYSGRGFHIHILDEKAFFMTLKERRQIAKRFSRYPIDSWVTSGYIELIRMPYTLNSLVSRKVIPIELSSGFNPQNTYPKFLKSNN